MMTARATILNPDGAASPWRQSHEPVFESPPWFTGARDRRLAGRVEAAWNECRAAGALPDVDVFARALAVGIADAGSVVRLVFECGKPMITDVGEAVASTFGLRGGALAGGGPLAAMLAAVCASVLRTASPATFEGGFARAAGEAATLLTRGIVLPLAGPAGTITAAYAVITWKEALSAFASDRLRGELALAYSRSVLLGNQRITPWH